MGTGRPLESQVNPDEGLEMTLEEERRPTVTRTLGSRLEGDDWKTLTTSGRT